MFSSACQGLQLCLEPKVVESHCLRLKLAPSTINFNPTELESMPYITDGDDDNDGNGCKPIGNQNTDAGGWSFLQSFACPKNSIDRNKVYVHPLVKRSASTLSEKSLDMCTESLGSETGSEIIDRSRDVPFLFPETVGCDTLKPRENSVTRRTSCSSSSFPPPLTSIRGCNPKNTRRMSRRSCFPPPLTSISGTNGVQVTSRREGGRLILQAVNAPTCHTYMHVERSEGRLRLCLLKDSTPNTPIFNDQDENEGEENKEQSEGKLSLCHLEDTTPIFDNKDEQEREVVAEEDEVEQQEEEKCHWGEEGVNVKNGNIWGKIGMGKLARSRSCKERCCKHKGLFAWETNLVAI
ncbi:hypothetical protein V6N13_002864 [Hibiscus sabdariffa]|uniref:FAF domain-containing protein n=2 Tax=Hibiscus sabdariffa TaxID=183260 RepID=A0ABR2NYL2_9ROSI